MSQFRLVFTIYYHVTSVLGNVYFAMIKNYFPGDRLPVKNILFATKMQ